MNNSGFLPRYSITLSYVRTQLCSGTAWHLCTSALFSNTACKLGKNKVYRKAYRNVTSHSITLSLLSIPLSPAWLPLCVYFLPNTRISRQRGGIPTACWADTCPWLAVLCQQDCGILNSRESFSRSMPIAKPSCTGCKNSAQRERIIVGRWTLIPQAPSQPVESISISHMHFTGLL